MIGFLRKRRQASNHRKMLAKLGHCGEETKISDRAEIIAPDRLHVGSGSFIGEGCWVNAVGGIHIGNYSGLGARTVIFSIEHRYAGADSLPFDDVRMIKPVYIEDFVWVGINVSILPGVRIGEGAIVGLGSVVTNDVPPLAIVMGNPAKVIGHRKKDDFDRLKAAKSFRATGAPTQMLWITPIIKRKYGDILSEFGFESDKFNTIFRDPRDSSK